MNNQRLKVLIIEDDLDDAKLLGEMLTWSQESAFRVIHADGISHALVCLARDKIDIALLGLPSSGGECLSDLHLLLTEAPNLPVVVMARPEDEAIAKEAVQAGAEDYLLKWQVDSRWVQRCLRPAATGAPTS